ncbi:MAG: hypothetical protein QNJ47_25505 [Nostocaceae cyanobacterium]|nr:hypothetical protein [Nostocaceae cyanobacterium]
MDATLTRAKELKKTLLDFVLEAEGDLAVSLETFSAEQLSHFSKSQYQDTSNDMVLDMFLTEGRVGDKTPIDLFLENHPDLSASDRTLVNGWKRGFVGLFAVKQVLSDGFELMNWLTAKDYLVKTKDSQEAQQLSRAKQGEILLTRIAPITDTDWMFSAPITLMGKLGKPKLAVAIGNFKDHYKNNLYGDAPELLAEAWDSVEKYHQDFIDFFGSDEVTLSGYELQKKLTEFQQQITQRRLEAAGIDSSKSLQELAQSAGISPEEITETAESMGIDPQMAARILNDKKSAKMVMPQIELPNHLKKAEEVTVITHPRWGQVFLTNYSQFKTLLEATDWQNTPEAEKLVREYLESKDINASIWFRLAQQYPVQLENMLRETLKRPNFNLQQDLNDLLKNVNKPINPALPEIASVPIHLHNLFQEALSEVNKKTKSKSKSKSKTGFGFQS